METNHASGKKKTFELHNLEASYEFEKKLLNYVI